MKCPHCSNGIHAAWAAIPLFQDGPRAEGQSWHLLQMVCPECDNFIALLQRTPPGLPNNPNLAFIAWPQHATRPVPPEVEEPFASDFREASATLSTSPKASAALSQRNLQAILHDKARIKKRNLDEEIQAAIDSAAVPQWISENLDAVRVMGNFAAHTTKSTNTGAVVEVEPGEAEFLLNVLEGLFDFYFVQPKRAEEQRAAINAKLQDAGKPPLKS
jgi:hypothetical protein